MADANVAVNFTASINDLVAGVSQARDALATLSAPSQQLTGQYRALHISIADAFDPAPMAAYNAAISGSASLESSLAAAHAQATAAMRSGDKALYADAAHASREAINTEIQAQQDGLKQQLSIYAEEARDHQISEQDKVRLSAAALDQQYSDHVALIQREAALGAQSLAQQQTTLDQQLRAEQRYHDQVAALAREAMDKQYQEYLAFGTSITGAFNSQLHGLITGTESWRTAFKNVLADLLVKFIEWVEKSVVEYVAGEAAKTGATTAGVAARTGAEQAANAASMASQGATLIRSILSSAAEAFAGVFGFLSPVLGPAAAGPAASAYGTVAGMAGAVASADIGMWSVPQDMLTLVHHNELIMPSSEASAFRNMLSGAESGSPTSGPVSISPTTHFHVSALDSGSVSQWMKSNSSTMLRAIDEAVRHGAALGLKRLQAR